MKTFACLIAKLTQLMRADTDQIRAARVSARSISPYRRSWS
jgi:hypothetical protein